MQLALRGGGPDNITVIIADATDARHRRGRRRSSAAPPPGTGAWPPRRTSSTPAARASALLRAAPGRAGRSRRPTTTTSRSGRSASRCGRAACCWRCWRSLGGGLCAGWTLHPAPVLRRVPPRTGSVAVFRGIPGQIAGLDLSTVHRDQRGPARRPHRGRPGAGQAGHPGQEPSRTPQRQLAELTSDDPANPNLKPVCPPGPTAVGTPTPPTRPARSPTPTGRPSRPTGRVSAARRRRRRTAPTTTPDATPSDTAPPASTRPAAGRLSERRLTSPRDSIRDRSAPHRHPRPPPRASSPAYAWPRSRRNAELSLLLLAMVLVAAYGATVEANLLRHGHSGLLGARRALGAGLPRPAPGRSGSSPRSPIRSCCRRWPCSTASAWASCAGSTWARPPRPTGSGLATFAGIGGRQLAWTLAAVILAAGLLRGDARPPVGLPVRVHPGPGRHRAGDDPGGAAGAASPRSTAPSCGSGSAASRSSPVSSPSWRCWSSSPTTWCASARCCRWPAGGSSASTSRAAGTSARWSWSGCSASWSWSSRRTSAPRCSTSACSW